MAPALEPKRICGRLLAALALAGGAFLETAGAPGAEPLREEVALRLDIEALLVSDEGAQPLGRRELVVEEEAGGSLALDVQGPSAWGRVRLDLDAWGTAGPPGGAHSLRLGARLTFPDGREVRASRSLALTEGSTGLFEVFAEGEHHLVLALRADRSSRLVPAVAGKRAGAEVLLLLEIERVEGDRSVPLEANRLSTLVGESVTYEFRKGDGDSRESCRIVLTPASLREDLAEIDVEVTGTLPGAGAPVLLSRTERVLASRGATSSMVLAAGDPPRGYRFRVTPIF